MEIENKSAKELWKQALNYAMNHGNVFLDQTKRSCKEVIGLNLTLTAFDDVAAPVNLLSSLSNWIYPRINEIESIILEKNISKSYAYSYGERIFSFSEKNINQIDDYVIPTLKKNKLSRRAVLLLWDPELDSDINKSIVPGLVLVDFKIRDEKLLIQSVVRSNDIFIGWPANIYQLYIIGKYVSEKLNVKIGSISTFSTSAHFFLENKEEMNKILN